ncbi:MAG TPA: sigma-54-dependent Fis family transcriptional regulator, partial [Chromatiales bacterium]|nr:sigma-54-dependent Fis family transcriptional regulator [Chromatiales bacterium]
VERLGGRKTIELDVRILATSNRELRQEVREKRFREDLYYRLNVFPLHLPPLRERKGDILPLAERLLAVNSRDGGQPVPELSADARRKLLAYDWPGNIRELENVIKRGLILAGGQVVDADAIQFAAEACLHEEEIPCADAPAGPERLGEDLRTHEQNIILEALRAAGGVRKKAAEALGISQRTLRYKIARMREAGIAVPGR